MIIENALKELAEAKEKLAKYERENEAMRGENARLEMEIENRDAFIEQEAKHVTAAEKLMHENNMSADILRQKCKMYREQLAKKRINENRLRMKLFRSKKFKNNHNVCLKQEKQIKRSPRIASAAKSTFLEERYEGANLQIMKDILRPRSKQKNKFIRPRRYSSATQDFALGIHYRSPAAYEHLRSTFCLPSKTSIQKLLGSTDCTPGKE